MVICSRNLHLIRTRRPLLEKIEIYIIASSVRPLRVSRRRRIAIFAARKSFGKRCVACVAKLFPWNPNPNLANIAASIDPGAKI